MAATDRARLLDLFCGAGGAGMGYHRAGFEVVGVDIAPQPRYPFTFIQAEALEYVRKHGREYGAIHASPPCQRFTRMVNPQLYRLPHPDLLEPTRSMLESLGLPYIIENVPLAPMRNPVVLCGQMFSIKALRHRQFEGSIPLTVPPHVRHTNFVPFNGYTDRVWRDVIGCSWMSCKEARQAIPPAYTEYLGRQLIHSL